MADIADLASDCEDLFIRDSLNNSRQKFDVNQKGTEMCRICGEKIPEKRRLIISGVNTCVECQEMVEIRIRVEGENMFNEDDGLN